MMWDKHKIKGFLESRYKVALRRRSFEETTKVEVDENQNETKMRKNFIFSKSKHQNKVNQSESKNVDKIEKERTKL